MSNPESAQVPACAPSTGSVLPRPGAWEVLAQALSERRPVRARYHGHERVVCPHVLGWAGGRAKVLAYQAAGTTSAGVLPLDASRRWRTMFVDELVGPVVVEGPWQSAPNYDGAWPVGMDIVEAWLAPPAHNGKTSGERPGG